MFVAYLASAELGCFKVLGWSPPEQILDLYVEFKRLTSGIKVPAGRGLLGALAYYGIDSIEAAEKEGAEARTISWKEELKENPDAPPPAEPGSMNVVQ